MQNAAGTTADHIMIVAERLLARASHVDEVPIRAISSEAKVSVSAINYHFGSRDRLIAEVVRRVYHRLCTERLNRLKRAADASAPEPPELEAVIAALVEPSIRWHSDPNSGYMVFRHFSAVQISSSGLEFEGIAEFSAEHLGPFVAAFRRIAPWLSDGEIGWRIHCALGIRQVSFRDYPRCRILTEGAFDPADPERLLANIIEVVAPMFRRPVPAAMSGYADRAALRPRRETKECP